MANIQIVKLTTGEDLIGDLEELEMEGRQFLLINKPALIMIMPQPGSETDFTVGLAPYAPFAKDHKVPIFRHVSNRKFIWNNIVIFKKIKTI